MVTLFSTFCYLENGDRRISRKNENNFIKRGGETVFGLDEL